MLTRIPVQSFKEGPVVCPVWVETCITFLAYLPLPPTLWAVHVSNADNMYLMQIRGTCIPVHVYSVCLAHCG